MASRAREAVDRFDGAVGRRQLVAASGDRAVDWAVGSGQLLRVLPGTFVDPGRSADWPVRLRAAAAYAGEGAAVSHLSALRVWGLPCPDDASRPVDVLVPHGRRPCTREAPAPADAAVGVHRTRRPAETRTRAGATVVTLERAVVESWPLLSDDAQRAPAIVAVRRRLTTPARLRDQLTEHPRLEGRAALRALLGLLELGCQSELELWGYQEVFTGPRFAHLRRQVPLPVEGRTTYLDLYDDEAMLDIELDGRAYHDSPLDRERDIARDVLVAGTGRLTLRFSTQRLTTDPGGCRERAWRVMQVRRRQLGRTPATGDTQPR